MWPHTDQSHQSPSGETLFLFQPACVGVCKNVYNLVEFSYSLQYCTRESFRQRVYTITTDCSFCITSYWRGMQSSTISSHPDSPSTWCIRKAKDCVGCFDILATVHITVLRAATDDRACLELKIPNHVGTGMYICCTAYERRTWTDVPKNLIGFRACHKGKGPQA